MWILTQLYIAHNQSTWQEDNWSSFIYHGRFCEGHGRAWNSCFIHHSREDYYIKGGGSALIGMLQVVVLILSFSLMVLIRWWKGLGNMMVLMRQMPWCLSKRSYKFWHKSWECGIVLHGRLEKLTKRTYNYITCWEIWRIA